MGLDYRIYTELGKQSLGGHKQNLVYTGTQEKGVVTSQETGPDLPVSVQSLQQRCGWAVAYCRVEALSAAVSAWNLLKEVTIIFITSTTVWSQVKQGGNRAPPINRIPPLMPWYFPSISHLSCNTWVTHNKCLSVFLPVPMITKHVCFSVLARV